MNDVPEQSRLRALFVDDEPRILDALRRLLRGRSGWELLWASGGPEALAVLDREPVDVVVTDLHMPTMNGATLLGHVRDSHPEVVRIMLSGQVDPDASARTTKVAHQYLNKPCEARAIIAALERASSLRLMLAKDSLRAMIGSLAALPSAPTLWMELQDLFSDPEASARDIAAVITRDVGMSAKVLQIANSAFMGLAREVTSVSDAVAYLGVGMLRNLVVSVEVFRTFSGSGAAGFSIDAMSQHGQACSQIVLAMCHDPALRVHVAATALLQDVGQLVLATCQPQRFAANLAEARARECSVHVVEQEQLGFSHADVGAYLLGLWGLPLPVVEGVAANHEPLTRAEDDVLTAGEAARVAHLLVQLHRPGAADPTDRTEPAELRRELMAVLPPPILERWEATARQQEPATEEAMV